MKIKKIIVCAALTFLATATRAESDSGRYLHVRDGGGWTVLNIDNVNRLLFNGGNMTAVDKAGEVIGSFPQSALSSMYVDEYPDLSDISDLFSNPSPEATFTLNEEGLPTLLSDGDFKVFDFNGVLLVDIPVAEAGQTVDLSAVTEKTLILKSGDYALKIVRR